MSLLRDLWQVWKTFALISLRACVRVLLLKLHGWQFERVSPVSVRFPLPKIQTKTLSTQTKRPLFTHTTGSSLNGPKCVEAVQ